MAHETFKIGPPRYVAAAVSALTPRAFRSALSVHLIANYTSLPDYFVQAWRGIRRTTAAQIVEAFSLARFCGDLCCLLIAFSAAPQPALAALLIPASLALIWRDAYSHPLEPSGSESVTDVLVLAVVIVVLEAILLFVARSVALSWPAMATQLVIAMALVSGWRFVFRMKEPTGNPLDNSYRFAWRVNVLWIVAALGLTVANTRIVVVHGDRSAWLLSLPIILFTIDYRERSNAIGGVVDRSTPGSIFSDPDELEAKRNRLILPREKTAPIFWWSPWVEPLFFVVLAFPIGSAVMNVLLERIPRESVDWMTLAANAAALVTLSGVWIEVKRINARVALDLGKKRKGSAA